MLFLRLLMNAIKFFTVDPFASEFFSESIRVHFIFVLYFVSRICSFILPSSDFCTDLQFLRFYVCALSSYFQAVFIILFVSPFILALFPREGF